jgi:type II secretory pathway component PulK
MKKIKQNGFVLILVITAIAVIGILMFVLAGIANTMMFQSNTAYLQACERNLVASGLAWAKKNIQNNSRENFDEMIELDIAEMNIRGSALDVTIKTQTPNEPEVQINTLCSRARRTLKGSSKHRIE